MPPPHAKPWKTLFQSPWPPRAKLINQFFGSHNRPQHNLRYFRKEFILVASVELSVANNVHLLGALGALSTMECLMLKILAATALVMGFAGPALALSDAECTANWTKMDAKKAGYVMSSDYKGHVDAMTKANMKMAAADRISAEEYTNACRAKIFDNMK